MPDKKSAKILGSETFPEKIRGLKKGLFWPCRLDGIYLGGNPVRHMIQMMKLKKTNIHSK